MEKFKQQGLRAVAINSDTLATARRERRDLWQEAQDGRYQIILTSPEMLQSLPFSKLIDDKEFRKTHQKAAAITASIYYGNRVDFVVILCVASPLSSVNENSRSC